MLSAGIIYKNVLLTVVLVAVGTSFGQSREMTDIKLGSGLQMLVGEGGNIVLSHGVDGVLLVDSQYDYMYPALDKAIQKHTNQAVALVINTHWHGDHTGNNSNLSATGAMIVAQQNVRSRLSKDQYMALFKRQVPASPKSALPMMTYQTRMQIHFNDQNISLLHVADTGHTDGDSLVWFQSSNVLHTGDLYFNGRYPFIDASSGGSIAGVIASVKVALAMIDSNTQVVPGHGPLSDKLGLTAYLVMLESVAGQVSSGIKAGLTLDQILANKPTAAFDQRWQSGRSTGDFFVSLIYPQLKK